MVVHGRRPFAPDALTGILAPFQGRRPRWLPGAPATCWAAPPLGVIGSARPQNICAWIPELIISRCPGIHSRSSMKGPLQAGWMLARKTMLQAAPRSTIQSADYQATSRRIMSALKTTSAAMKPARMARLGQISASPHPLSITSRIARLA